MALQYKFFTISLHETEEMEKVLNRFLRSVRVVQVERHFVAQGEYSRWALAVEYMDGPEAGDDGENSAKKKNHIDYKQVLSPEDFAIFASLREWRKAKAFEEGTPVYTIFTNEQLAKIAVNRVSTKAGLGEIEGIGSGRISKYGEELIRALASASRDDSQEERA
jgi:superfamily II DNA helicase RecQ